MSFFWGPKSRFLAKKSDFCDTTPILVNGPFVALRETVHFSPWDRFFDFPFPRCSSFRKKTWLTAYPATAVTPERKVEKSISRWEMNRHSEGYNGSLTKIGVVWQKSDFWTKNRNFGPKTRRSLFDPNHVLATTEKSCSKKKRAFAQIIKGENVILGDFLG